ncbi:MAG: beta/gamma crystallin-related protein [Sphingopyxis sp.]|nr:beta/gamma crystallin-related protein [Sphingopyxis sp.]
MQRFKKAGLVAVAVLALGGGVAVTVAQDKMWRPAEATIYRDVGYNGPAVAMRDSNPDMGLAWPVNAIRVQSGVWQLCEQRNYRGRCRTYDRDTPMLGSLRRGITVQSIRLLGGGGSGGGGYPGEMARDQTVRGNFAQFHTQPSMNGYRVESCPVGNATAACMKRNADAFCRATGWNGSGKAHQETVRGRVYLADVLCVRSGY